MARFWANLHLLFWLSLASFVTAWMALPTRGTRARHDVLVEVAHNGTWEPRCMSTLGPIRMASPSELAVQVNANGSIRRIDHRDVMVNAFLGNEVEGGPTNLFL